MGGERVDSREILNIIEILRKQLVYVAQDKSLVDPDVVQLSQKLDECLNLYYITQYKLDTGNVIYTGNSI